MDTDNLPVNRKQSIAVARLFDRLASALDLEVLAGFLSYFVGPGMRVGVYYHVYIILFLFAVIKGELKS